jgi:N-acetylglutamate synthase-like GNAT family acetyltransferase
MLRVSIAPSPVVAVADRGDLAEVRALLDGSALPSSDLSDATTVQFWVVRDGRRVIGAVGLESFDKTGLLRSLVVSKDARGRGLGGMLVASLEGFARAAGLAELVLLTQTAEAFFAGRGYVVIARANAPVAVRESSEFKSLCPASAVCMSKRL